MSRKWTEKQSGALMGKWFNFKTMGYSLLLVNATQIDELVSIEYILEKQGRVEQVKVSVPVNSEIPSVTEVFPQGGWMQEEIAQRFPVRFQKQESEKASNNGCSFIEWGPFHPMLPEPVKFGIWIRDEVIMDTHVETGFNFRGAEASLAGRKPEDALDLLERIPTTSNIPMGMAFIHAVEEIHGIEVSEKARWLRMMLMEMSFLSAALQSIHHTARSLGLAASDARIFRMIGIYREATALIGQHPQLSGLLGVGGLNHDISRNELYAVNAVLQELEKELKDLRDQWENTSAIAKRLKGTGKVEPKYARVMTGRLTRAAGYPEDTRKYSVLPWSKLDYTVPTGRGSNCFSRAVLMFKDALLSLDLINQIVENLPKGEVKVYSATEGSGRAIIREPEAFGGMAALVSLEAGRVDTIKIRNATAQNFPFLPKCLKGLEMTELPLFISGFDLDLSGMEK